MLLFFILFFLVDSSHALQILVVGHSIGFTDLFQIIVIQFAARGLRKFLFQFFDVVQLFLVIQSQLCPFLVVAFSHQVYFLLLVLTHQFQAIFGRIIFFLLFYCLLFLRASGNGNLFFFQGINFLLYFLIFLFSLGGFLQLLFQTDFRIQPGNASCLRVVFT